MCFQSCGQLSAYPPSVFIDTFWHFRVFMLLRVYLLRVGFGCITFPTVLLVLKDMLMFVFFNSFV